MGSAMPDNFFGRKTIFSLLKKRFLAFKDGYRQNIALLGSRYIGKTSVVQRFAAELDDRDVVPVYVDLAYKDFPYLFSKYVGGLLYNYCRLEQLPLQEDLNLLIEGTKSSLPHTHKAILKIQSDMKHIRFTDAYRHLMALPEIFTAETNKFCVIILDEFHNLEALELPHVFQELGNNIMTQKRCLYVLTSSVVEEAEKILSEKLSLLFGNFETVFVEPFDVPESQAFTHHSLEDIKVRETLRDFLVDFTGGYPLYLQLILQELKYLSAIHQQREVYSPLLVQAIENIVFNPWGTLSRHFEDIVDRVTADRGTSGLSAILIALTTGKKRLNELTKALGLRPSFVSPMLQRLIQTGVVVKNSSFFYLSDKLFKYWVKYVFYRRLKAVDCDSEKQRQAFREEVGRSIDQFRINSTKDMSLRIVELLYCFDNESLNINGRKYKLPVFTKVEPFMFESPEKSVGQVIQAMTLEGPWFIIFKKDKVGEADVNAFLLQAKKNGHKPLGCIVISPTELDENTRIRALQERMWIWSEHELNTLSNFYDQPLFLFTREISSDLSASDTIHLNSGQ